MFSYRYVILTHLCAEFTEPLAVATVIPPSPYIVTEISTEAASHVLSREQSPFPMTPTSPIQELGSPQAELVDIDGPPALDDSALSLSEHLAKISAKVMALGDKSLLMYQGMLSRLEHLQVGFSILLGLDIDLITNKQAVPSSPIIQNLSDVSVSLTWIFYICIFTNFDTPRTMTPTPFLNFLRPP